MTLHRFSFLLTLVVLVGCHTESGDAQSSSSTNWLRCESTADCTAFPGATCSTDGYCEDSNGQRIREDAEPPEPDAASDDDVSQPQNDDAEDDDTAVLGGHDVGDDTDDDLDVGDDGADDASPSDDTDVGDDTPANDDTSADDSANDDTPPDGSAADDDPPTDDDGEDDDTATPATSVGTVTIRLEVTPDAYCNPGPNCDGPRGHISIVRLDDGATLRPPNAPPCGYTPCETCEAPACIGAACLPAPRLVSNEEVTWDGSYQEPGSCAAGDTCYTLRYAPAGRYLARMCATPGSVVGGSADAAGDTTSCERSGPDECYEVEFEYPSSEVVIGRLAGSAPGTDEDAGTPEGTECSEDADCTLGGLACCDGRCVNLYNDPFNCGTCGNECGADAPYCAGSCQAPACAETCSGQQVCCLIMLGPWAPLCSDLENGTCPVGCPDCACAAPDTPIATPEGERRIDEIREGELVYSIDDGAIVAVPVARVQKTPVWHHQVVEVRLSTGAVLQVSALHPTADGRTFADLDRGGELDGVAIESVRTVPYPHPFTHDILPASSTGTYFANGVAIGSTLWVHP